MPNRKTHNQVVLLESKGVFGTCSCGAEVRFYSNNGVVCSKCGKLYGIWSIRKRRRASEYERLQDLLKEGNEQADIVAEGPME